MSVDERSQFMQWYGINLHSRISLVVFIIIKDEFATFATLSHYCTP
jgi:hypothetical protein